MNIPECGSEKTLLESVNISGYTVKVYWEMDDIIIKGSGFILRFPEAPKNPIQITKTKQKLKINLLDDNSTHEYLMVLGKRWQKKVQERIRKDWGEKAFIPDKNGDYHHPLAVDKGKIFYCVHCLGEFSGKEVAENNWHCPKPDCDASPLDISTHDFRQCL